MEDEGKMPMKDKVEDKLLYQQKSALVFTEVSIAVDIKVLEDVTTATFCGSWFSISSGQKNSNKKPVLQFEI